MRVLGAIIFIVGIVLLLGNLSVTCPRVWIQFLS